MLTEEYRHDLKSVMLSQSDALMAKQNAIATSELKQRTGTLASSFQTRPTIGNADITVEYPLYIRFLDMKKGMNGKRKKKVDIYSKPVWGYIVAGIRRWLNAHIPELMIRTIDGTLTGKKQ